MSSARSAVYIHADAPITAPEWETFCAENRIIYSPKTIGGNIYYRGDTEIRFSANHVTVSTYWKGNLLGVASVARAILARWSARFEFDKELRTLMLD